jgi:uncharacterized protein (TIRG00374 family)
MAARPADVGEPDAAPRARRVPWLEVAFFLAGLGFFVALLAKIGAAPIGDAFALLGPRLALIVAVESVAILANTISWRYAIAPERRRAVPFLKLMAARMAGDSLNYVIPAGTIGGEIPKARLIQREIPLETAVASVTIAKLTEAIALGIFGAAGAIAALPVLAKSPASRAAVAVAVSVGIGLAGVFFVATRFGLFSTGLRLLQRVGVKGATAQRLAAAAHAFDGEIARFQRQEKRDFALSTVFHLVGWLVNVGELWLTFRFLGLTAPFALIFATEALVASWDGAFFFMPAKAGSEEGGRVFVLGLFGFSAAQGLTIGLVRRTRELTWTAIGLVIYAVLARAQRPALVGESGRDGAPAVANA